MLNIRPGRPGDAACCAALAHRALEAERMVHRALPAVEPQHLMRRIRADWAPKRFFVALEDGAICGYLGFLPPFDGAFGCCRGVFSPLHLSAFYGSDPERTFAELNAAALEALCAEGIASVAISRYAHEKDSLQAMALNGYGIRCCDLMRRTASEADLPGFVRTAEGDELDALAPLVGALKAHMERPPVLMPQTARPPQQMAADGARFFAAYDGKEPYAFLSTERGGETFLDDHSRAMHISMAYCAEERRGSGAMTALVRLACDVLRREGMDFLGVDCETLNPPAYRFWRREFTPFAYSGVRRLDERMLCGRPGADDTQPVT